ncbi:MAG: hypothetical protein HY650_05380 [Acidobacteria bacterium]|nr:hypothetical protein [Acidobacteriota bacterium]
MLPKQGKSFDPALIPKAIQDAGFTAREVMVIAAGTLSKRGKFLELDIPGLKHSFVLAGGARAVELSKRAGLAGKKIRVTGNLHPSYADHPPGLTVEDFQ